MKTEWNYSALAKPYLNRPDYSSIALDRLFSAIKDTSKPALKICDMGAGVAHLTIPLLKRGYIVDAVEPNDEMRKFGKMRTQDYDNVAWFEGTGETSGRPDHSYDVVTFGSSFNVTDRPKALLETSRVLKSKGWFACMWNHRDLENPIQHAVEQIILKYIPNYDYGARREDQTQVIRDSGLFYDVGYVNGSINHQVSKEDWIEAWRSHATLHRQAGEKFEIIIDEIASYLDSQSSSIEIPYETKIWYAQKKL